MNVAADEGQTVVHAHLEINHPETTYTHTQMKERRVDQCLGIALQSTLSEFRSVYLVCLKFFQLKLDFV